VREEEKQATDPRVRQSDGATRLLRRQLACYTAAVRAPVLLLITLAAELAAPAARADLSPAELVQRALGHLLFRARGAEMQLRLELRGRGGELRTRTLFSRSCRADGLGRSLVRVLAPSEVAGTAFLFVERRGGDDEQYMYLPSLRVVRRIVGEQKRASFMGSDFTYADLEWSDLDGARCARRPDERVGAHLCHVVDCEPRVKGAYERIRAYVRQRDTAPLRVQFFDGKGEVKTLFVKELKPVGGALIATSLRMVDHRGGQSTDLYLSGIKLRDDLPPSDFTPEKLRPR